MHFNVFAHREYPDQGALVRHELPDQDLLCLLIENDISDPTLVDFYKVIMQRSGMDTTKCHTWPRKPYGNIIITQENITHKRANVSVCE